MNRANCVRTLSILFVTGMLCVLGTALPACSGDDDSAQYGEVAAAQSALGAGGYAGGPLEIDPWKALAPSIEGRAFYQAGPPVVQWQERYMAARAPAGSVQVKQLVPTVGSWVPLPSISGAKSSPTLSILSFGSGDPRYRLCAFIVGSDSKVYVSYAPQLRSAAGTWSNWTALPTMGLPSAVVTSAVSAPWSDSSPAMHLWARGLDGFPYKILGTVDWVNYKYVFPQQWLKATLPNGNPYPLEQQLSTAPTAIYESQYGYEVFGLNAARHPIVWVANNDGNVFSELTTFRSSAVPSADLRHLAGNVPAYDLWMRNDADQGLVLYRPGFYPCNGNAVCVDWLRAAPISFAGLLASAPGSVAAWNCAEVDVLGTDSVYWANSICDSTPGHYYQRADRPTP